MDDSLESTHDDTSMTRVLLLGLAPLGFAVLVGISLSLCIQFSRYYSNWRLNRQLIILRSSEQCLIVSNQSIDQTDLQSCPQVI